MRSRCPYVVVFKPEISTTGRPIAEALIYWISPFPLGNMVALTVNLTLGWNILAVFSGFK